MKTSPHTPSPNRLIAAFLAHKSRLLAALKDEGGLFECRFLARLLDRSSKGIATAHTGAVGITAEVCELRQFILRETAPGDNTPGILDPTESEAFLQKLANLGTTTRHHEGQLEQLT